MVLCKDAADHNDPECASLRGPAPTDLIVVLNTSACCRHWQRQRGRIYPQARPLKCEWI